MSYLNPLGASRTAAGMRSAAEGVAQEALDTGGHAFASARIDGARMLIRGSAPDRASLDAACKAATDALKMKAMVGLPGVVNTVVCEMTAPGGEGAAVAVAEGAGTQTPAVPAVIPKEKQAAASACGTRLAETARSGQVTFALQRAEIAGGQDVLDRIAAIAKECSAFRIEVGGHTDARGGDGINVPLSQARAEAVRRYLIAKGVPSGQLSARGYGSSRPLQPGNDVPVNRRTEFTITALN